MYIHAISCVCIFYDILGDIKNKHALANGGEVKSQKLRILEIGVCVCVYVCVWGQPLFRRAFITCPIFSYSSQFTSRGTRHP